MRGQTGQRFPAVNEGSETVFVLLLERLNTVSGLKRSRYSAARTKHDSAERSDTLLVSHFGSAFAAVRVGW